jgi:recombinational DNA repair protein (RecF pathway)
MMASERHEDFSDELVSCVGCGYYVDPDEVTPTRHGPRCQHCVRSGEADVVARPLASGVHVSTVRQVALGALGFTDSYRNARDGGYVRAHDQEVHS